MSTLQRTSGKLSSLMRDLWVTQACNAGVQLTGDILRLKWRDFEKLAGIPEDEQLVPNGFQYLTLPGIFHMEWVDSNPIPWIPYGMVYKI